MRKLNVILLTITLAINAHAQDNAKPQSQTGLFITTGAATQWGNDATEFSKNNLRLWMEVGPFLAIPFSERNFLKTEVAFAFHSADYQFASGVNGIANQKYINLNFKWQLKNRVNNNGNVELALGPGLYTVSQKRIPFPSSVEPTVNDGNFAYIGTSINADFTFSFPFGNGTAGFVMRAFYQLPFTMYKKSGVPTLYNSGVSVGWMINL